MLPNSSNSPQPGQTPPEVGGPNQPAQSPKLSRRIWISIGLIAWTFFGFMLAQAIGAIMVLGLQWLGVPFDSINPAVFNTVYAGVVYTLAVLLILGVPWLIKRRKTTLKDLALNRPPHAKDILWLFAGVIGYMILTVTITTASRIIFPAGDYEQEQDVGFEALSTQLEYVMAFISLVIVAPIAEEVIFRGYLFGKLKKYAKVWISVVLSALLFAIAHFQFNVGLDTFALGVVLALLRVVTGSLWASILLHMLKNGVAFYFLFVNPLVL